VLIGATARSPRAVVTGVFSDASMLGRGFVQLGGRTPEGLERPSAIAYHLAPDGTLADTIGAFQGDELFFIPFDRGFSFFRPPFGRTSAFVVAGDRLHTADSEHAQVRILSPDGTPRMLVRWAHTARRIDAQAAQRAREQRLNESDARERPEIERMFRDLPMPVTMPAFSTIRVDDDLNLWVQAYLAPGDEGETSWTIFDRDGRVVTRLDMPAGLDPTHIGTDFVLGVWRNELDVEHVRLYRLDKT
jgi:hypothetical protein